jgi:thioredoxin 1
MNGTLLYNTNNSNNKKQEHMTQQQLRKENCYNDDPLTELSLLLISRRIKNTTKRTAFTTTTIPMLFSTTPRFVFVAVLFMMLLSSNMQNHYRCVAFTPLLSSSSSSSTTILRQKQSQVERLDHGSFSHYIPSSKTTTTTTTTISVLSKIKKQRRRTATQLYMAVTSKTGGILIQTPEQYLDIVMENYQEQLCPIVVFWTAPWCGPCRLSIPVIKDIIKQFNNKINVYEVCTDDLPDVANDAGVVSIPTIHIYYRGKLCDTIIGCVAKSVLANTIDKTLEDIALQK